MKLQIVMIICNYIMTCILMFLCVDTNARGFRKAMFAELLYTFLCALVILKIV